jgi:hypothetical protein
MTTSISITSSWDTIKLIGKGGSSTVFKARLESGQLVAVKQIDTDGLTKDQQKIKENLNINIIPKINCVNPSDRTAIIQIMNNNVDLYVNAIGNMDDFYGNEFDENDCCYNCKDCNTNVNRKSDFIRHLRKQHNYNDIPTNSKIYKAYEYITNYFKLLNYDEDTIIKLYRFILDDIDIQLFTCTDPGYIANIFEWENNRGKNVSKFDVIKNRIINRIKDEDKIEIYEIWEILKTKTNNTYEDYGTKLFDIAIQLYNNKFERQLNKEEIFNKIVYSENTYREVRRFYSIVEELSEIMDRISNDKYGRLINNTKRICLNWEAYMWGLLPIFYITRNINTKLIHLFTKWYFRNMGFKNRTFNNLCYSNKFIEIVNKCLEDTNHDYLKDFNDCLESNKDQSVNYDNYVKNAMEISYKGTNATYTLLFLETCINTDILKIPLEYTLEHIYPQKFKDNLKKVSIDNIGNLTLIEGKNSDNGHKGNSSIGCKKFIDKKISYKESSCKITRQIAVNYNDNIEFTEENIVNRSKEIAELLNVYTNY